MTISDFLRTFIEGKVLTFFIKLQIYIFFLFTFPFFPPFFFLSIPFLFIDDDYDDLFTKYVFFAKYNKVKSSGLMFLQPPVYAKLR